MQPEYNLITRERFEGALQDLCLSEELGVVSYYGLAAGFLTGKYRAAADLSQGERGGTVKRYLEHPRGLRMLAALDAVAARHDATPAAVALAWVMTRPGVTAPIASATSVAQVDALVRATQLTLTADDLAELD